MNQNVKMLKLVVIGSSWVHLERVNPMPSLTHSARVSELTKAKVELKCVARCLREIELIR
ncbi:hypothetical protein H5410_056988, partial [Solanum commersonii]